MEDEPLYRIQREAAEDAAWKWFVGLFRRLRRLACMGAKQRDS